MHSHLRIVRIVPSRTAGASNQFTGVGPHLDAIIGTAVIGGVAVEEGLQQAGRAQRAVVVLAYIAPARASTICARKRKPQPKTYPGRQATGWC